MAVTLVHGGTVIQDDRRSQREAAVAVESEQIVAVGPLAELQRRWPNAATLGGSDKLVMPGLANAHDHGRGVSTFDRGLSDGALEVWRPAQFGFGWPAWELMSRAYALQALRSGITTLVQHHPPAVAGQQEAHAGAAFRAFDSVGLRTCLAVGIWDQQRLVYAPEEEFLGSLPPALAERARAANPAPAGADELLATVRDLVGEARASRVTVYLGPYAPQWVSEGLWRRLKGAAEELGAGLHTHLLETPYQRQWAAETFGRPLVEVLDEWGVVDQRLTCAHGVWLGDRDVELLAARGASVSHNPTSNLRLRNGIARVPLMLEKGLNVGIGLDGMSFIQPDLFAEMRLALTLGRPPGVETPGLDAHTIFKLATQGGTRAALGRDDLGVLEASRPADLVVLDASRLTPFSAVERDPVELVVGRGRPELVETVMVGGEVLVRDGRHVRQDLAAVERELNDALAEMAGQQPEPWRADLNERMRAFYAAWPIETRGWEAAPPSYA